MTNRNIVINAALAAIAWGIVSRDWMVGLGTLVLCLLPIWAQPERKPWVIGNPFIAGAAVYVFAEAIGKLGPQ